MSNCSINGNANPTNNNIENGEDQGSQLDQNLSTPGQAPPSPAPNSRQQLNVNDFIGPPRLRGWRPSPAARTSSPSRRHSSQSPPPGRTGRGLLLSELSPQRQKEILESRERRAIREYERVLKSRWCPYFAKPHPRYSPGQLEAWKRQADRRKRVIFTIFVYSMAALAFYYFWKCSKLVWTGGNSGVRVGKPGLGQ